MKTDYHSLLVFFNSMPLRAGITAFRFYLQERDMAVRLPVPAHRT
jgi:hypothetical protein